MAQLFRGCKMYTTAGNDSWCHWGTKSSGMEYTRHQPLETEGAALAAAPPPCPRPHVREYARHPRLKRVQDQREIFCLGGERFPFWGSHYVHISP